MTRFSIFRRCSFPRGRLRTSTKESQKQNPSLYEKFLHTLATGNPPSPLRPPSPPAAWQQPTGQRSVRHFKGCRVPHSEGRCYLWPCMTQSMGTSSPPPIPLAHFSAEGDAEFAQECLELSAKGAVGLGEHQHSRHGDVALDDGRPPVVPRTRNTVRKNQGVQDRKLLAKFTHKEK